MWGFLLRIILDPKKKDKNNIFKSDMVIGRDNNFSDSNNKGNLKKN